MLYATLREFEAKEAASAQIFCFDLLKEKWKKAFFMSITSIKEAKRNLERVKAIKGRRLFRRFVVAEPLFEFFLADDICEVSARALDYRAELILLATHWQNGVRVVEFHQYALQVVHQVHEGDRLFNFIFSQQV
jgi:hypothetical protein